MCQIRKSLQEQASALKTIAPPLTLFIRITLRKPLLTSLMIGEVECELQL